MTNGELTTEFVRVLLESPDLTIRAVQERLIGTDYEIKLFKSDLSEKIFRPPHSYQFNGELFPIATAQKGG